MRSLRTAAVALVATIATPLATATTASAAQADGWRPILDVSPDQLWFSPNQDGVSDKAEIGFSLREKSEVTVKVRRNNQDRTLVYKEEVRNLPAGFTHGTWKWNGKNSDGKLVRDGRYTATFTAKAVIDGKRQVRSATMWVDTEFDKVNTPTLSVDTIYPKTTLIHDALGVTLTSRGKLASVSWAELRVRDAQGRLVRKVNGGTSWWHKSFTLAFDGRDDAGAPLPGGEYTIRAKMKDRAGNLGKSERMTVNVADKPLLEKTVTLVLPPTGSWKASEVLAGTAPAPTIPPGGSSSTSAYPCGKVVPSEVYPNAGAASFRSDETCTGSFAVKGAYAGGSLTLDNPAFETAPRGSLYSSRVSMRGRPTVSGETDTATVTLGGPGFGFNGVLETPRGVSSPAVAEETITTTETVTTPPTTQPYYIRPTYAQPQTIFWTVLTRGTDSFEVADITVTYTYLAPQP